MRKILEHLNNKNLYPDSLLELDWIPQCVSIDNDNGNHWITVTDWGTDIRQIFNALGLDYESKPNLLALLNATKDIKSEWGVTVNSKSGIYGMYVGSERTISADVREFDPHEDEDVVSQDISSEADILNNFFPMRKIETVRTRSLFTNNDEWIDSFIGVGFYYDSNTDKFLTYKHYYDAPEPRIVHVYKKRPNQPIEFIVETATRDMSKFNDEIGIKKFIGPDFVVASVDRLQSSKNDNYLMIQTQNYVQGII